MQRPVGSVGVEALPGGNCAAGFDNYCGVSRLRRAGHLPVAPTQARVRNPVESGFSSQHATPQKSRLQGSQNPHPPPIAIQNVPNQTTIDQGSSPALTAGRSGDHRFRKEAGNALLRAEIQLAFTFEIIEEEIQCRR